MVIGLLTLNDALGVIYLALRGAIVARKTIKCNRCGAEFFTPTCGECDPPREGEVREEPDGYWWVGYRQNNKVVWLQR